MPVTVTSAMSWRVVVSVEVAARHEANPGSGAQANAEPSTALPPNTYGLNGSYGEVFGSGGLRAWCGAGDDAVDGGAADAVFIGQVREARVVVGVVIAPMDRFARCQRQFRLLPSSRPFARALAMPSRVRRWFRLAWNSVRISPASATLRANRSNLVVVKTTCRR